MFKSTKKSLKALYVMCADHEALGVALGLHMNLSVPRLTEALGLVVELWERREYLQAWRAWREYRRLTAEAGRRFESFVCDAHERRASSCTCLVDDGPEGACEFWRSA